MAHRQALHGKVPRADSSKNAEDGTGERQSSFYHTEGAMQLTIAIEM